eukprot:TRINITY_DN86_c0_g1_i1.p3 TRINITY_DN86_c0_g1~~TRINITY_DN86_c0_g1_i1.p3  ORF type:complete len:111 (-),score=14.06 TRINITY_DN86_c0_g1_i1:104-415(-)
MASKTSELACTYAALILHDEGVEITQDKIAAIVQAAGVQIEGYYPMLFAKYLAGKNLGFHAECQCRGGPNPSCSGTLRTSSSWSRSPCPGKEEGREEGGRRGR